MRTGSAVGAFIVALAAGWIAFGMGRGTGQSLDFSAGMAAVVFLSGLLVGLAVAGAFTREERQMVSEPAPTVDRDADLVELDEGVEVGPRP